MSIEKNGVGTAGGGALRTRFCRWGLELKLQRGKARKDGLPSTDSVQGQQGLGRPKAQRRGEEQRSQVRTGRTGGRTAVLRWRGALWDLSAAVRQETTVQMDRKSAG